MKPSPIGAIKKLLDGFIGDEEIPLERRLDSLDALAHIVGTRIEKIEEAIEARYDRNRDR